MPPPEIVRAEEAPQSGVTAGSRVRRTRFRRPPDSGADGTGNRRMLRLNSTRQ